MTTILADARLGVMVADSAITDGDRVWSGRKVWRVRGVLIGIAGTDAARMAFLDWFRNGMVGNSGIGAATAILLDHSGVYTFDSNYKLPQRVESGREAIGSGGKAAMCAYEALGFKDPRKAVRIVAKHDEASRSPVKLYPLDNKRKF